nr:MAG TPA: hemolysin [Caudoviricetes sp.]
MDINTGVLIAVIGCIVGLAGWLRNHDIDNTKETSNMTTVIVKLENIRVGISDLKSDLKRTAEDLQGIDRRLTIVEQSAKQAHKRIDELKGETRE